MKEKRLGIYIHIPFCKRKCAYCDFLSFSAPTEGEQSSSSAGDPEKGQKSVGQSPTLFLPEDRLKEGEQSSSSAGDPIKQQKSVGQSPASSLPSIDGYVEALCQEIFFNPSLGTVLNEQQHVVDSIFIGGGTPSLLSPAQIKRILDAVRLRFKVSDDAEISMESNPGAVWSFRTVPNDLAGVYKGYLDAGVNRLSIGVQSLQQDILTYLGRLHTKEEFLKAYHIARQVGFDNINIDMMFGIPTQGIGPWQEDLKEIVALRPEHISFYSLKLEEGTTFWQLYEKGDLVETDPALDRRMYAAALDILKTAGYEHYEISNAAMPGRACRHNLKYWSMEEYIGFGLGSHSYVRNSHNVGVRYSNTTKLDQYLSIWDGSKSKNHNLSPLIAEIHTNSRIDDMSEYIFTGMRKSIGISMLDFEKRFGDNILKLYQNQLVKLMDQGLIEQQGDFIRLTRKGIDISNQVFVEFV